MCAELFVTTGGIMNFLSKVCGTRTARIAFVVTIAIGLLPEALNAKSFKLKPTTIVPGATGEVKTGKDKNGNTKFNIKVKYMAEPAQLTPPKSVYVVWIQVKDGSPVSQGAPKVMQPCNHRAVLKYCVPLA
jgi:hypothetical protein